VSHDSTLYFLWCQALCPSFLGIQNSFQPSDFQPQFSNPIPHLSFPIIVGIAPQPGNRVRDNLVFAHFFLLCFHSTIYIGQVKRKIQKKKNFLWHIICLGICSKSIPDKHLRFFRRRDLALSPLAARLYVKPLQARKRYSYHCRKVQ